jgi:hypothetical protein
VTSVTHHCDEHHNLIWRQPARPEREVLPSDPMVWTIPSDRLQAALVKTETAP